MFRIEIANDEDYARFKSLVGELNDVSIWYAVTPGLSPVTKIVAIGTRHKWNVAVYTGNWNDTPSTFLTDFPNAINASANFGQVFKLDSDAL